MAGTPDRSNFAERIKKLEDRINALERTSKLSSASVGEGGIRLYDSGSLTVDNGGEIVTRDEDGNDVAKVGYMGGKNSAYGFVTYDDDGNEIMFAGRPGAGSPTDLSTFTIWDQQGHEMFSNDESGFGLDAPKIAQPVYPFRDGNGDVFYPSVTSASYEVIWLGEISLYWPRVKWWAVNRMSGTATSMSLKAKLSLGQDVIAEKALSFTETSQTWIDFIDITEYDLNPNTQSLVFTLEARRNGGSGTVGGSLFGVRCIGTNDN